MQPGTTRRQDGTADRSRHTVRMAVRRLLEAITLTPVCMVQRARRQTLTAAGEAQLQYVATSGRGLHIDQTRRGLQQAFGPLKEREAPATAVPMGIAASSRRARMTICTPARMGTSIARSPAVVGRSMKTVAGRIRHPSRLLMPRTPNKDKGPKHSSVQLRVPQADPVHRNSQQSPQGQFSSSIATPRHAKQELSGHGSTNNQAAQIANRAEVEGGVREGPLAVGTSELHKIPVVCDLRMQQARFPPAQD